VSVARDAQWNTLCLSSASELAVGAWVADWCRQNVAVILIVAGWAIGNSIADLVPLYTLGSSVTKIASAQISGAPDAFIVALWTVDGAVTNFSFFNALDSMGL
jgi:hypothetical protein